MIYRIIAALLLAGCTSIDTIKLPARPFMYELGRMEATVANLCTTGQMDAVTCTQFADAADRLKRRAFAPKEAMTAEDVLALLATLAKAAAK